MANAWQNVDIIAAEALRILTDELVIANLTSRDKTSDFMTRPNGYRVGDTVRILNRPDYKVNNFTAGGNIEVQDIRESTRSMTIENHYDVSVEIGAKEKTLDLESFSEQVVAPGARRLAEQVDKYVGTKILEGAGLYASGTLLQSAADVAQARKEATLQQLELSGRYALLDLDLEATVLGQEWFNQSQTRGSFGVDTLQSGQMGHVMGMDFFSSINFPTNAATIGDGVGVTNNTGGTTNLVGMTAVTTTATTGQMEAGDRIMIAGVRRPLIVAAQTAATATSIPVVDPITEIIPDGAAITTIAAGQTVTYNGAIFDNRSMAVAMPMLDPASDKPSSVISDDGVSIRIVQGYDMITKTETLSMDLLVGATAYDPRRITLLASQ
ncbi:MAG: hypothetical protein DRH08_04230 [Deltaproteobacteria bacterium]|nr:MAG: hypothetical protein DRH08_04230 [Deltaproteobacteria bacterium]